MKYACEVFFAVQARDVHVLVIFNIYAQVVSRIPCRHFVLRLE